MEDRWFPGPVSHPYPGVSNCRSDKCFAGDPQFPIVGLPDCENGDGVLRSIADVIGLPAPPPLPRSPVDPGLSTDDFQRAGIPVPENYSAPSLHRPRGGPRASTSRRSASATSCSRSARASSGRTRPQHQDAHRPDRRATSTSATTGRAQCTQQRSTATWTCPNPGNTSQNLPPISDHNYQRMKAQVNNPADGWNDLTNAATAESEPTDPTQIKGNYTHERAAGRARATR